MVRMSEAGRQGFGGVAGGWKLGDGKEGVDEDGKSEGRLEVVSCKAMKMSS